MRFTDSIPDQQLFTDIQNLNSFSDDQLTSFVAIALSFLKETETNREGMGLLVDVPP